jgi:multiple sugar transport system permease protein
MRRRGGRMGRRLGAGALALVLGVLFIFPFYWVLITSLNGADQVLQFPPPLLPSWQWANYARAWSLAPWARYFGNTLFMGLTTTALVLLTSVPAGYAFASLRFPGRRALFTVVLSILMIPFTVLIIPDYLVLDHLGWLNTYQAQIVPFGASVFGIFLLRQVFRSLPRELWEAAQVDGCGHGRYMVQVAVPLAGPALVTIALLTFLGSWNAFLWPYIMTSSAQVQPVEVGLATFLGANGTDFTGLAAAVVFTTAPVLALFLLAQRHFVAGAVAMREGLKG